MACWLLFRWFLLSETCGVVFSVWFAENTQFLFGLVLFPNNTCYPCFSVYCYLDRKSRWFTLCLTKPGPWNISRLTLRKLIKCSLGHGLCICDATKAQCTLAGCLAQSRCTGVIFGDSCVHAGRTTSPHRPPGRPAQMEMSLRNAFSLSGLCALVTSGSGPENEQGTNQELNRLHPTLLEQTLKSSNDQCEKLSWQKVVLIQTKCYTLNICEIMFIPNW